MRSELWCGVSHLLRGGWHGLRLRQGSLTLRTPHRARTATTYRPISTRRG
jgi:hypothetical protein